MPYDIQFVPSAAREFRKLAPDMQRTIAPLIDALSDEPRPDGCKKIAGTTDCYRIRHGDLRVLYQVRNNVLVVLVLRIGPRDEAYRALRKLLKARPNDKPPGKRR